MYLQYNIYSPVKTINHNVKIYKQASSKTKKAQSWCAPMHIKTLRIKFIEYPQARADDPDSFWPA